MIEAFMQAMANNPELTVVLAAFIFDFIAGVIPDEYVRYIGIVRRILRQIYKRKNGTMVLLIALVFTFMGCSYIQTSKVCETEQKSLICEKIPHPEQAGILLQIANITALKKDAYSAEQAFKFLDDVESFLKEADTYGNACRWIANEMDKYDLEVLILSGYIDILNIPETITEYDRELLLKHIERQRALIKTYVEKE